MRVSIAEDTSRRTNRASCTKARRRPPRQETSGRCVERTCRQRDRSVVAECDDGRRRTRRAWVSSSFVPRRRNRHRCGHHDESAHPCAVSRAGGRLASRGRRGRAANSRRTLTVVPHVHQRRSLAERVPFGGRLLRGPVVRLGAVPVARQLSGRLGAAESEQFRTSAAEWLNEPPAPASRVRWGSRPTASRRRCSPLSS
jgi:hypothetical protein